MAPSVLFQHVLLEELGWIKYIYSVLFTKQNFVTMSS